MTSPQEDAVRALRRAEKLLTDLDVAARTGDVQQARSGALGEIRSALQAILGDDISGERAGLERADAADTSRRAASAITLKAGTQRYRLFCELAACAESTGFTDRELQERLQMSASSERPRRVELVRGGYVTALPDVRRHDGQDWTVWTLTDHGRETADFLGVGQGRRVAPGQMMIL